MDLKLARRPQQHEDLAGSAITKLKSKLLGRGKPEGGRRTWSWRTFEGNFQLTRFDSFPSAFHFILAALDPVVDFLRHQRERFADVDAGAGGSLDIDQLVLLGERLRFLDAHLAVLSVVDEVQLAADECEDRAVRLDVPFRFQQPQWDVLERRVVAHVVDE